MTFRIAGSANSAAMGSAAAVSKPYNELLLPSKLYVAVMPTIPSVIIPCNAPKI